MITHNVKQGSPEWVALRADYDTASEAPCMMGAPGAHNTREELLRMKVTGFTKEHDQRTLERFADGHRTEAAARPIIERLIGEELYPVTGSLEGTRLLASYDGMDMGETMAMEHKLWNQELVAALKAGDPPARIYWQLEQQLLVGGLDHILWVVSDGSEENMERMEYRAVPGRREQLLAGWKLFNEDRANYKHQELPAAPVKTVIEQLPALQLRIAGEVMVQSNLPTFMEIVQERVRAIKTELVTDQDFADAKATVAFLKDGEDKIKMAMDLFLNQSASIAEVKTKVEALLADIKAKRLALDRGVSAQETSIRVKIKDQYEAEFATHIADLNAKLSTKMALMPAITIDIPAAIKGKRNLQSIHDACKQTVANGKLAAGDAYQRITENMAMMREHASQHMVLFQQDVKDVLNMTPQAASAVVQQRIAEYEAGEKKKRDDAAAAEKRRNAMSEIQAIQHQVVIAQIGRLGVRAGGTVECMQETLAETRAWIIDDRFGELIDSALQAKTDAIAAIELMIRNAEAKALEVATTPPADPVSQEPAPVEQQPAEPAPQVQASAPAPAASNVVKPNFSPPTMTNGKVCQILGFTVTAEFLTSIGAPTPTKQGNANLWHDHQIMNILEALGVHMSKVYAEQKAKYQPARSRTATAA